MGFTDDLAKRSAIVGSTLHKVVGEANTKAAFISPFLSILGYDTTDPAEVMHEYCAHFGTPGKVMPKKVDYAIAINGNTVMLIEAKACTEKPEDHSGQLKAYFNAVQTAKIGVVTNGVEYRFFTDLKHIHMMDDEAFFTFNILDYSPKDVENLKLFHRDNFDASRIKHDAEGILYSQGMSNLIDSLLVSQSDNFIRFLIRELGTVAPNYEFKGVVNANVITRFKPLVKRSIQTSLIDLITNSVNQKTTDPVNANTSTHEDDSEIDDSDFDVDNKSNIFTTEEELAAFKKIQAIVKTSGKFKLEIQQKDTTSYFGINLGKTTWWFLRLYLSSTKKSFIARINADESRSLAPGFTIQEVPGVNGETLSKVVINSVDDFEHLKALILRCYELEAAKH
jgi:predicted type IV restriction endonuclease